MTSPLSWTVCHP